MLDTTPAKDQTTEGRTYLNSLIVLNWDLDLNTALFVALTT